jgi:predicted Zn-dependent protease
MPNAGTITAGGALTLTVALPQIYDGGCWMYFPAAAFNPSTAAGFYYCVMSTTTVGTVYTNYFDPATSAEFTGAKPTGALVTTIGTGSQYTAVTTAIAAFRATIPGSAMGAFGNADILVCSSNDGTGATKTTTTKFGGTSVCSSSQTTTTLSKTGAAVSNRGSTGRQVAQSLVPANVYMAIDTNADVAVTVELASGATTAHCVLDRVKIALS